MALSRPFEEESNTFYASLLQVVDVVMPLALCRQVLSQALSTETQAACDDCPPPPSLSVHTVLVLVHVKEMSRSCERAG